MCLSMKCSSLSVHYDTLTQVRWDLYTTLKGLSVSTRQVHGTPTSEVTPVTIDYIWLTSDAFYFIDEFVVVVVALVVFLLFCLVAIDPWKGEGCGQIQNWWPYIRQRVQSICMFFISRQSDHFFLMYSKLNVLPWNLKVQARLKIEWNLIR